MKSLLMMALMAALCSICSPVAQAQMAGQSAIRVVRIDTVTLRLCEGQNFLMGVGIGDLTPQDNVVGMRVVVMWDRTSIDFEDLAIFSSETLGSQMSERTVTKSPNDGVIIVELGDTNLKPMVGSGKPLFFLKGRVTAPDTVDGLNGWVVVSNLSIEGNISSDSVDRSRPGKVRVIRDTTAAFTGTMGVEAGAFDTALVDTVTLTIQNLRNRRVNDITFSMKADTQYYSFVDTIETGSLAGSGAWTMKEVRITSDSIWGRLVAPSALNTDGALLKIVLRRKTDSAFTSMLDLTGFSINQGSCLGKLLRQSAQVSARAIRKDTSATVEEDRRRDAWEAVRIIVEPQDGSILVISEGKEVVEAMVFDVNGVRLPVQSVERNSASTLRVRLTTPPPSGIYFLGLRGRNEIGYKQFTIIK